MPTENRSSNTEQMVSELLPCPFCKTAMRIESNRNWHRVMGDHDEECVFLDPETMMVPATDEQRNLIVRDWNRRAQPATQLQGEPVAYMYRALHDGLDSFVCLGKPGSSGPNYEAVPLYSHPPTNDSFSAGNMADQGAKAFRDGQRDLVLPARKPGDTEESDVLIDCHNEGWNACLEEVRRLNAAAIAPE